LENHPWGPKTPPKRGPKFPKDFKKGGKVIWEKTQRTFWGTKKANFSREKVFGADKLPPFGKLS